jgi:dTDP-4-dehydrorhamnose reductase
VVHFSTDYVFNGQSPRPYPEDDATNPIGAYGASKLAGERTLLESGARCAIIRTSWLFGFHGKSFPRTMWQRAREGKATRVVNDQVGRPTYTVDLATATWGLIGQRITHNGQRSLLLHVANTGAATWYEIARRIFQAAGVPDLVSPCTTAEYPTPARRPAFSVFDTSRYDALAGARLPRGEDALDRLLAELEAA